jgi:hypothetical protein
MYTPCIIYNLISKKIFQIYSCFFPDGNSRQGAALNSADEPCTLHDGCLPDHFVPERSPLDHTSLVCITRLIDDVFLERCVPTLTLHRNTAAPLRSAQCCDVMTQARTLAVCNATFGAHLFDYLAGLY